MLVFAVAFAQTPTAQTPPLGQHDFARAAAARSALNAKAKAMYYYIGFPILLEKGKLDKAVIA